MKVNIELNLDDVNNSSILMFLNNDLNLNVSQLNSLSTYLEQVKQTKSLKNFVSNHCDILHAINYDSDEVNNYWIILDKNFNFMDVGIPVTADLDNDNLYNGLSENESKLIKLLKNA
jgi:hypothetical protein